MEEVPIFLILRYFFISPQETNVSTQTSCFGNFQGGKVQLILFRKLLSEVTLFRKYYDRGDLPVAVSFNGALRKVSARLNLAHMENGALAS